MAEKHVFWDYFFQRCRKEVSEAVSDMAHTFYVLPEQLSASFRRDFPEVAWDSDPALALPRMGDLDLEEVKKSTYFFA